jgi:hypothetical protein
MLDLQIPDTYKKLTRSHAKMNEFSQGWKPLLAATIGTMCGIFTLTNYSQGFFVGPVTAEFGWTPPQFFLSYTVMMCLGLITGPIVGSLVKRHGMTTRDCGMKHPDVISDYDGLNRDLDGPVIFHQVQLECRRHVII